MLIYVLFTPRMPGIRAAQLEDPTIEITSVGAGTYSTFQDFNL